MAAGGVGGNDDDEQEEITPRRADTRQKGYTMKRKRKLTPEQEAAKAERKAAFDGLVKRLAGMNATERDKWAAEAGTVVTIEGHVLSPRNTVLCYFQRDGVSMVGGFRQWIKAGRCVRKGEKGFSILVPCTGGKRGKKADAGHTGDGDAPARVFFMARTVFDISQTAPVEEKAATEAPQAATVATVAGDTARGQCELVLI